MFPIVLDDQLRLERLHLSHAEDVFALVNKNRKRLKEWLPWLNHNTSLEQQKAFIEMMETQYQDNRSFNCVIFWKNRIVGMVGYHPICWKNKKVAIGYWLDADAAGHGIMTRSAERLVQIAFEELQLNRVEIRVATGNVKSRAIPERLGFPLEGIERETEWLYDRYVDHAVYAKVMRDWNLAK